MSDEFIKRRMKLGFGEETKEMFKSIGKLPAVSEKLAEPDTFLKRRIALGNLKSIPGPIGKAVTAAALAGAGLEAGIQKLKSMKGKEAEPEIPSGEEVTGKAKGGSIMAKGNKLARMKPTKMY